ncbi:MAG: hypothetical protein ABR936_01195 [Bacteroidota bacterium]|jgi:hypothetical protein
MHLVKPHKPVFVYADGRVAGPMFHVATLRDGIDDGPRGIWISNDCASKNPTLRTVELEGLTLFFKVVDPLLNVSENAPIRSLLAITRQSPPGSSSLGNNVPVDVYAEWKQDVEKTKTLLESAIDKGDEDPEIKLLVHKILSEGYKQSCQFIDNMRRSFLQYWLLPPQQDIATWSYVTYFSIDRGQCYAIKANDEFLPEGWERDHKYSKQIHFGYVLLRMVEENDLSAINSPRPVIPQTFADEMVSTALVELSHDRTRSAIIHAIIALESSAKNALRKLLEERLKGLEQGSTLEAISRELSTVTLARVIYSQFAGGAQVSSIDWTKIEDLYNTRNTIVHRGQRRLPSYETLRDEIVEVFKYVQEIEKVSSREGIVGEDQA